MWNIFCNICDENKSKFFKKEKEVTKMIISKEFCLKLASNTIKVVNIVSLILPVLLKNVYNSIVSCPVLFTFSYQVKLEPKFKENLMKIFKDNKQIEYQQCFLNHSSKDCVSYCESFNVMKFNDHFFGKVSHII